MSSLIQTSCVQLGPRPEPGILSGYHYSYDGEVRLVWANVNVINPLRLLQPGGHCNGDYTWFNAPLYFGGEARAIYEFDRVIDIYSIVINMYHDGDTHIYLSMDGVNWTESYFQRTTAASAVCSTFECVPWIGYVPPAQAKYMMIFESFWALIGSQAKIGWFAWTGPGGIYTDDVRLEKYENPAMLGPFAFTGYIQFNTGQTLGINWAIYFAYSNGSLNVPNWYYGTPGTSYYVCFAAKEFYDHPDFPPGTLIHYSYYKDNGGGAGDDMYIILTDDAGLVIYSYRIHPTPPVWGGSFFVAPVTFKGAGYCGYMMDEGPYPNGCHLSALYATLPDTTHVLAANNVRLG